MFSPTEERVLKILGKRRMSLTDIAHRFNDQCYDKNARAASAIRRINKKCRYHKLDWFINGYGVGRGGRTVWKDRH